MDCYPCIYNGKAKNPDYSKFKVRQQKYEDGNDFYKSWAQAGFYRGSGYPGCVTCIFCGVSIRGLEPGERARDMTDHEETMRQDERKYLESTDTDKKIEDLNSRASIMMMDRGYTQEQIEQGILKAREKYLFPGISDGKAKNPDFSTFKARQKTFEEENPYNESLEKAGFYRTGLENVVTCFYCGVSIMSLDPNKNVWVQHAMYSPDCGFLNLNKREIHGAIHPIRLDEDKDLNCIDKDQMIEDKNSRTSMMLMKGYRNEEVENGILKAREKYEKLLKEINALKSRMACKICLDNEACVLFQPCGHMVSCVKCASNLKTCAICRVEITNTIRAYPV